MVYYKDKGAERRIEKMEQRIKSKKFEDSYIRELVARQKGELSVSSKYYEGNIEEGKNAILRICEDKKLRDELFKNGLQTAQERDWNVLEDRIKKFYEFK